MEARIAAALVGCALALASVSAGAQTPNQVEFALPTNGVTAAFLGGQQPYTIRLVRVGYTVEREPIMGYQICGPSGCKRTMGLDQLLAYTTYVQAVYLVDAADRPAFVGYDGFTMTFCFATNYTTSTYQGFACSQTAYRTTAKPWAVRGIAGGQNSYSIAFGAPVPSGQTLQSIIDEANRNEAFTHNVKSYARAAAQNAAVPLTRKGPACSDFADPVSTRKDAHALRIVPQCVAMGWGWGSQPGEDAPGITEPIVEPSIPGDPILLGGDPSKGVLVTCKYGSEVCWPLAWLSIFVNGGGQVTGTGDMQVGGAPTPTPAEGTGDSGKPNIQDPKKDCVERAEQRKRVNEQFCARVANYISSGTSLAAIVMGVGGAAGGYTVGKIPGALVGFVAGWEFATQVGDRAGDNFKAACDDMTKTTNLNDMNVCNAITQ